MDATIVGTGYNPNDSLKFDVKIIGADIPTFTLVNRICRDERDIWATKDEVNTHITNLDARRLKVLLDSVEELWDQLDERLGQLLELQDEENEVLFAEEETMGI